MSSLPKLCPNCKTSNPAHVIICRNCGFSFDHPQILEKPTDQVASVSPSRTNLPLFLEIISDWLGIFFSLGFNLKRFLGDPRGWIKFMIDICVLAVISGSALLLSVSFTDNFDNQVATEIRDLRLDLGVEGGIQLLLSGILYAFGSAIGTLFYLIVVHYIAMFLGGKGDLFDHFHMNLSVDVIYNLMIPLLFIIGAVDIIVFLLVAAIVLLYRVYLQLRVIQTVHQIPFVFALLAAIIAPMIFSCVWLPISAGG